MSVISYQVFSLAHTPSRPPPAPRKSQENLVNVKQAVKTQRNVVNMLSSVRGRVARWKIYTLQVWGSDDVYLHYLRCNQTVSTLGKILWICWTILLGTFNFFQGLIALYTEETFTATIPKRPKLQRRVKGEKLNWGRCEHQLNNFIGKSIIGRH